MENWNGPEALKGIIGINGVAAEIFTPRFFTVAMEPFCTALFILATFNIERIIPVVGQTVEVAPIARHASANVNPPTGLPLMERTMSPGCNVVALFA